MWCNKPNQQAERFLATVFFEPRQGAVHGQIIGIHIVILLLGPNLALSAFLEEGIDVVIPWIVVAKVIIPVAVFNAIADVHLSQNGDLIASFAEKIGEGGISAGKG
jgi:hypothetical protein